MEKLTRKLRKDSQIEIHKYFKLLVMLTKNQLKSMFKICLLNMLKSRHIKKKQMVNKKHLK